jgi:hypothetical protein
MEIRTNIHLEREQLDNTTYARSHEPYIWQQSVMIIKELDRVLPHPSACLPHDTSTGIHGWPIHYPDVHPRGMVGYRPTLVTIEATQFAGPHKSRMCQYIINAYSVGPNRCTP